MKSGRSLLISADRRLKWWAEIGEPVELEKKSKHEVFSIDWHYQHGAERGHSSVESFDNIKSPVPALAHKSTLVAASSGYHSQSVVNHHQSIHSPVHSSPFMIATQIAFLRRCGGTALTLPFSWSGAVSAAGTVFQGTNVSLVTLSTSMFSLSSSVFGAGFL